MKRTLILTILFLLAAPAVVFAQPSVPGVRYVSVAPTGACSQSPPVQVLNSSGAIYTCNNGTWAVQGGGGGSGPTQTCDASTVTEYAPAVCVFTLTAADLNQFDGTSATAITVITAPGPGKVIFPNFTTTASDVIAFSCPMNY